MKKIFFVALLFVFVIKANAQTQIVSAGTGAAYTLTFPGVFAYTAGISVTFKAHIANTGAATININALSVQTITKNSSQPLVLGDIATGQFVTLIYDGANFQMVTPSSNAISGFANTSLSNLISTSVNQSLTPNATNTYSLGSNTMAWSDNYLAGRLYIAGLPWTSTSTNNTLIGTKGGEAFTSGVYNLGVGQGSGNLITTGVRNTVVGHRAGETLTTQQDNTFIGSLAGGLATGVGNNNTFLGSYAGYLGGNTGSSNTFLGYSAGDEVTSGGYNTVVGTDAGQNLTTGTLNTFLGYYTGLTSVTQRTNSTAIGYNATVDADNTVVLGNSADVAIGTSASAKLSGSTRYLTLAAIDNGTSNGIASLELVGNTSVYNTIVSKIDFLGLLPISNATVQRARIEAKSGSAQTVAGQLTFWTNNGTNATSIFERMRITEFGNVGIGTNAPTAKLHVGGTAGTDGIRFPDGTLQTTAATLSSGPWTKSGTNIYPTTLTDYVGIGTITPGEKLDVNGNIRFQKGGTRTLYVENATLNGEWGAGLLLKAGNALGSGGSGAGGGDIEISGGNQYDAADVVWGGNINLRGGTNTLAGGLGPSDGNIKFFTDGTERMRVSGSDGNVGIGTTTPSYKLDVFDNSTNAGIFSRQNGSGYAIQGNGYGTGNGVVGIGGGGGYGVLARSTSTGAALYADVQGAGTGPAAIFMGGDVGIGTTPNARFHVNDVSGATTAVRFQISGATKFRLDNTGGLSLGSNAVPPINGLNVSGDVGIGVTPVTKLDVNGNVAFRKPVDPNLGTGSQIDPSSYSFIRFTGSGGSYTLGNPSILAGSVAGQILVITSNTAGLLTVRNGATVKLAGGVNYTMNAFDSLSLIWDGAVWIETSRSDYP